MEASQQPSAEADACVGIAAPSDPGAPGESTETSLVNHDFLVDLVDIPLGDDEKSLSGHTFLCDDHSKEELSETVTLSKASQKSLAPDSVAGIVEEVLQSLQRARQEFEDSPSKLDTHQDTFVNATPDGLEELKNTLKTYNGKGLPADDTALLRRVEDFHRARFLRRQQTTYQPWGIYGLFQFLSNLQLDLEWAEDAAWRRLNGKVYLSWSDFQAIHRATLRPTYFVYTMMLVCTAMLVVSFQFNDWHFAPPSVNPMLGPSPDTLLRLGALQREAVLQDDEYYRLFAPIVLHAGVIHYAVNVLATLFIGGAVERRHGTVPTTLLFLVTAVGGNIASALFMPSTSISVGSSGGIFGLLGVCLSDILINWDLLLLKTYRDVLDPAHKGFPMISVIFWLIVEITMNALLGLTPYVDQFAHIAGLFFGLGLGVPFLQWLRGPGFFGPTSRSKQLCCGFARFFLFVLAVATLILLTFLLVENDGGSVCESCRYISCAPLPFWGEKSWWKCDDCDLVHGKLLHNVPTTVIELTCPGGVGAMEVDLIEPNMDRQEIEENLSDYCREYCLP